jgi:uncharacterized glyoxalase superfamily protein PhnB
MEPPLTLHSDARLTGSAPVLLVKNAAAAADYYVHKLGFSIELLSGDPPYFAIVARDGLRVFLQQASSPDHVIPHWTVSKSMWNIYFWVDDPDALYQELVARGATIDYGLSDRPYGCREFGVRDLDDYDIAFGKPISI